MDIAYIKAVILFIIAFLNFLTAYIFWQKGKEPAIFHLGWFFFSSGLYVFSWAGLYFFDSFKLLWVRGTWVGMLMIPAYLAFTYYFTGNIKFIRIKTYFLYALAAIIFVISLTTPYVMPAVGDKYPYIGPHTNSVGILNSWFRLLMIVGMVLSLYYLIRNYLQEIGFKKWQLKYFVVGAVLTYGGGLIFSGFLVLLNYDKFVGTNDVTAFLSVIMVTMTTYAVFKNYLFNIKVVLTEVLVGIIGLIFFIQIFLASGQLAQIVGIIIFFLYLAIGYLLIKATYNEIKKEERAQQLATKLEDVNKNLELLVNEKTVELRVKLKELNDSQEALINILEDNAETREKMEEEKNKTMAIIANFTDPIIVLDKDFKIIMINPAASREFGLSEADLGRKVSADNKFSMSNFKPIIKKDFDIKPISEETKEQIFALEEITTKKTAAEEGAPEATYKVITAKVIGLNNEPFGIMKIFNNTTREKAIDKMKSEFISIAAHQLRTPLSAIKWVIKMILDGDAGELTIEQQELLNKGYLSNERIIRLVNDLLNVSRIEEGRFGFNFEKADFQEILSLAISNVESLITKNHQELIIEKPPALPNILLDKERMIMVLQNILSNAIKYTPEYGKIKVIVEVDKQSLYVKINDQGVGIPAKDQPKLFSKFFRASNVVKLETDGTGLGLFIVKNIIEKHHGRVSLKSEEGKGTEVSFSIPINGAVN